MRYFLFAVVFVLGLASGCEQYVPLPETSPSPSVSQLPSPTPFPSPSPSPAPAPNKVLVTLGTDIGASVDVALVNRAFDLMNRAYANGCLRSGIETHKFASLNSVFSPGVSTSIDAARVYLANAPYAIDPRWYYKGWPSKVIGYTYNFKDDNWSNQVSETRIWTNTRYLSDEEMYASHLAHELSHQARAGGFVHYTIFDGSFPYDVGDIMAECVKNL